MNLNYVRWIIISFLLANQGASDFVCSIGELEAQMSSVVQHVSTALLDVQKLLLSTTASMLMRASHDLPEGMEQVMQPPTQVDDLNPNRRTEIFVGLSRATTDIDRQCAWNVWLRRHQVIYFREWEFVYPECAIYNVTRLLYVPEGNGQCAKFSQYCPVNMTGSSASVSISQWAECPIYCLQPQRFGNHYDNFLNDLTTPLNDVADYLLTTMSDSVTAMYFIANEASAWVRYAPSLAQYNMTLRDALNGVDDFFNFHYYLAGPPHQNISDRRIAYSESYPDSIEPRLMITAMSPVNYGGFPVGVLCIDQTLDLMWNLLGDFMPTTNSISFIATRVDVAVVIASRDTFNTIFCPSTTLCSDENKFDFVTNSNTRLGSSPHAGLRRIASLIANQPLSQQRRPQIVSGALPNNQDCYMISVDLAGVAVSSSAEWVLTTLVPVEQIDEAAVWEVPTVITVSDIDRFSTEAVNVTIQLSNKGCRTVPWLASLDDVPFADLSTSEGILVSATHTNLIASFVPAKTSMAKQFDVNVKGANEGSGKCFVPLICSIRLRYATLYSMYEFPAYLFPLVAGLSGFTIFVLFTSLAQIMRYRNAPMVKVTSPPLLTISFVGGILLSVAAVVFSIPLVHVGSGNQICQLRWFTTGIGFTLMFAPLILKTWRIYKIFSAGVKATRPLTNNNLLTGIAFLFTIMVSLMTVQFVMPNQRSEFELVDLHPSFSEGDVVKQIGICTSRSNIILIVVLLLAYMTIFSTANTAWMARNVPQDFNEAGRIAIAIMFLAVYGALIVPILVLVDVKMNPMLPIFITGLGINIGVIVCMAAQVVPILDLIHSGNANRRPETRPQTGQSRAPLNGMPQSARVTSEAGVSGAPSTPTVTGIIQVQPRQSLAAS